jgi:GNAT superfamily N-acetyltransferase
MGFEIVQGDGPATWELRQRVLRPHQRTDEVGRPADADPRAGHFRALESGTVVGVGSIFPEPPPWDGGAAGSWRIVGMATAEGHRGLGVGSAVLAALVEHARAGSGRLVWCNARMTAVDFYRRFGFETRGEPWEEPEIGPHVVMAVVLGDPPG